MREQNLLIRWEGQSEWHMVPSHNHGKTESEITIQRNLHALEYVETGRIENVMGLCKKCYHEACINDQDQDMWLSTMNTLRATEHRLTVEEDRALVAITFGRCRYKENVKC